MYHTSQHQKTEGRGCHSCEANLVCEWVKGIREGNRSEWICEHYANEANGYYLDAMRLKKVKK